MEGHKKWQPDGNQNILNLRPESNPGGVLAAYVMGSDGASYYESKKIHEPETLYPQKYLASKLSTQKNTRLSTSILIYSIKQT